MRSRPPTRTASRLRPVAVVVLAAGLLTPPAPAEPARPANDPRDSSHTQRVWTVDDGAPPGTIHDLAETRDGYLWLATYGGLVRFDGQRFVVIDSTTMPSLASSQVSALATAEDGSLWVGPVGASIFRTDGRREVQVLPPRPNGHELVRRLGVAPDGTVWVVSDTAVERFAGGRWQVLVAEGGQPRTFRTLFIGRAGDVWVGATDGVFRVAGDRVTRVLVDDGRGALDVRAIAEDPAGRLWVGGSDGLDVLSRRDPPGRARRVAPVGGPVTAVLQDSANTLWVATPGGVHLLGADAGASQAEAPGFVPAEAFGGSAVERLLLVRSGAVIAATTGGGLHVFTRRVVRLVGQADGLPGLRVHHLAPDGAGGLWVGSGCGGLTRVALDARPSAVTYLPPAGGLRSSCVRGLLHDRRGRLWVGQAGGTLTRLAPDGTARTWTTADGLPGAELGPLLEDRDGRLWVGSRRGALCVIETGERVSCPQWLASGVPEKIWSLAEDAEGSVWVGQVGRLTRITRQREVRSWTPDDGLPPSPIRAMLARPDGALWLATYGGGLARLRGDRIARVGTLQGLVDNSLSAIVSDVTGRVWLLGNRGLFVTRWADLDAAADGSRATVEVAAYGPADGVPEGNGGHPASAALPDGRIGFATVQGLIVMDPGRHRPDVPPLVLLDSVSGAESTSGASDHFIAPPGGGPLVFGFTAPSIGAPGSVRVRFRLRGRDRDWVEAGLEGRAVYSDLAPGDYALDLSARLADGPWSNPVTAATVVARPFWWQTAAARGLALVVLVLGLAGAVHLRLRAAERRNRELAREIRDRVTAEQEAHRHLLALARVGRLATAGELAASLAHELGQPLTAIAANAEAAAMLLASPARDPDRIAGIVGSIGRDGRRAAEVVRGLRTFLKRGEPEFAPLDVNHAVREVMTLLESTLASARVRLHLELADGLPPVPGDRVPLQLVVLNLTLNAVEALRGHESERRCVMVRTRRLNGHVRVSVLDSGPGLPAGQPQRLFEPFHTTKRGGMGMGLAISRSIVEAHGGHIGARNRGGAGAVFSFTLPVQRSDSRR